MADFLHDVREVRLGLLDISQDVDRQIEELGEFITGQRTSPHPLGKVLLTNLGRRLDELRRDIELRLSGIN